MFQNHVEANIRRYRRDDRQTLFKKKAWVTLQGQILKAPTTYLKQTKNFVLSIYKINENLIADEFEREYL